MPDKKSKNSQWEFPQLLVMSGILVAGLAFIPAATEHYLLKASVIEEHAAARETTENIVPAENDKVLEEEEHPTLTETEKTAKTKKATNKSPKSH